MIALLNKEINSFFSTLTGYLIISLFLIVNGVLLWSEISTMNILDYGYANMDVFFTTSPLLFLLFIPAVSMRVFAEEYNTGTIEVLLTKPITLFNIVLGKYLAVLSLVVIAVFPTLIYVGSIYFLGETTGNLDGAAILGSYIGLLLLSSLFAAISVYASSITSNQIIAFVLAIILNSLFYFGFELISEFSFLQKIDLVIQKIGISYHYSTMSKGLIQFSDIIYFLSVSFLFLKFTELVIKKRRA